MINLPRCARIIDLANPRRVILFGSQARETAREGSDIDLLIVEDRPMGDQRSRRREIARIRRGLPLLGVPIDILLFTPDEVENGGKRRTTSLALHCVKGRSSMGDLEHARSLLLMAKPIRTYSEAC